jgi:hypothetical protein
MFTWSIYDKNCHIIRSVSGATVSKIILAYMNYGKTTSVKRNSGLKSTLTEETIIHREGLFKKITELLQHRGQQN